MPDNVPRCELHHLCLSQDGKSHMSGMRLDKYVGPCTLATLPSVPTVSAEHKTAEVIVGNWFTMMRHWNTGKGRIQFPVTQPNPDEQKKKLIQEIATALEAAHKAGLEQAAQACDARVAADFYRYGNREAEQCAIAIRALRATPAAPEEPRT